MRRTLFLAVLLAAVSGARAADPALLADAQKDLGVDTKSWDEKAVLAALLARPAESAEFDAQGRVALKDPALRPLFIQKWRGKIALFAETESHIPYVDGGRRYANWTEVMSPEQRAYTVQRMKSMAQEDRDKLIYYLNKLNENLKGDDGNLDAGLFGVSRKIANGIMDKYRSDLSSYLATPGAQEAEKKGAAAATQLAAAIQAKNQPTQVAAAPLPAQSAPVEPKPKPKPVKPEPVPAPAAPVPAPSAPVVITAPAHGALDQAEAAARAGTASGAVFDGGTPAAPAVAPMPLGAPQAPVRPPVLTAPTARPTLAATGVPAPGQEPGAVPAPGSDEDLMKQVSSMGSGAKPTVGHTPLFLAGIGALIGGLIGFFVGGPVGAAVGAAVLGGGAYLATKNFF